MDNVEFFTVTELNGTETEWAKITVGENAYVWQPKAIYDEQQAAKEAQSLLGGNN